MLRNKAKGMAMANEFHIKPSLHGENTMTLAISKHNHQDAWKHLLLSREDNLESWKRMGGKILTHDDSRD